MTIKPCPTTLQSVVHEFIEALGAKQCAKILGKSEWTIYKAKQAGSGYMLPHEDFIVLDASVARMRGEEEGTPYQLFVQRRVRALASVTPTQSGQDINAEALDVGAAVGELQAMIRAITEKTGPAGSFVTAAERADVITIIRNVERELGDLLAAVGGEGK